MDVNKYIEQFIAIKNPILQAISREEQTRNDIQPDVGIHVGTFLALMIRIMNAKKVLEIGTCLGYSTIFLAEALKDTNGKLISIELNPDLADTTRKNIHDAGLSDIAQVQCGDASLLINQIDGEFDLILQDSDKTLYPKMLDACVDKLRMLGILVADDTLFYPMGIAEKFSKPMDEYNKKVFADPRLKSTILPIGDGITVSVKISF
ncbi:MAG: O-methyltransferase [Oligoflexia bacterium]|nr:O-methyltransferase [Oligoflexia bacterium]